MWKSNYKHLCVGNDNGSVDIFEYQKNKLELRLRIYSFKRAILCVKWNSNKDEETSNWLAISSYDNYIHCYSLYNYFKCVDNGVDGTASVPTISRPNYILKGHSDRISSMSWCPFDSNKLVSVSYDKTALIWDVLKEKPLIKFSGHRGILYSVVWSAFDEDLIFSGGEDNYFHAWRPSKQMNVFDNSLNDRLLSKENNYWPHLDDTVPSDEKCVANVLKEVVDKKIEDIEAVFQTINGQNISEESRERTLLYGNYDDIKEFVRNEISNHVKQGNNEQKDIINLLVDIKSTIEESIEKKATNPYLVSLSIYASRNHWKESCKLLAQHLLDSESEMSSYKMYTIEMSAVLLVSQNSIKEAIDLLLLNHLFREALIVAKVRYQSEEVIQHIMTQWATHRKNGGDFEGAAKCLTASTGGQLFRPGLEPQSIINSFLTPVLPRSECVATADNRIGLYQGTCKSVITANETYFVSPSYPALITERLDPPYCIFTLQRNPLIIKWPVCQIRLDFEEFSLAPPINGTCNNGVTDSFIVSGATNFNQSGLPGEGLCGELTGQHIYLDVDPKATEDPLLLIVNTANEQQYNRKWSIRIQQVECRSPFRAPSGSLQHYTTPSGIVESLNFRGIGKAMPILLPGQVLAPLAFPGVFQQINVFPSPNYFNNMHYGITIAKQPKMCGIRWAANTMDFGGINVDRSGVETNCVNILTDTGDYITIPDSSANGNNLLVNRFCGQKLSPNLAPLGSNVNEDVFTYLKPFQLYVHSDALGQLCLRR
ncbi:unnamed protein product [Medioppia subpectinata]|uniref:Uncharacterized protein n=1 Tax=Medioppia subpectinata TaxID=1979941 RepID=A0A7R9PTW7_9ACAR|nr:unnamed protein product [Medioppia subpectinata]CAG2100898.1 unnamed protein product [Medioppia subpectinata]